jgi:hypothetical protein
VVGHVFPLLLCIMFNFAWQSIILLLVLLNLFYHGYFISQTLWRRCGLVSENFGDAGRLSVGCGKFLGLNDAHLILYLASNTPS